VEVSRIFKADRSAPRVARRALTALSDSLPAQTYRDLQLILTELVTNAIKFGPPEDVRIWVCVTSEGGVRGEVTDAGAGGAEIDPERPFEDGGLGLQIVDALCSAWCNPAGTGRVWFALEAPAIV
jgi:two-component sensor histidine kinase